jgi:hypothetical protein
MERPDMNKLFCAAAFAAMLSGCAAAESGDRLANAGAPIKARFEFVDPDILYRSRLTESQLDRTACTFESLDRDANRQLRARLFESLVTTPPSQRMGFEPRNKLVFYFEDGKTETLVYSGRDRNGNALDADWQGRGAQVANSLPVELAHYVRQAQLPQLNPQAGTCAFLFRD